MSTGMVRSLGHTSGVQAHMSGESSVMESKFDSTSMQGLFDPMLLLLKLGPRRIEMKSVEETLRRFVCQTNRGLSHDPMMCIDHAYKSGQTSTSDPHFMDAIADSGHNTLTIQV